MAFIRWRTVAALAFSGVLAGCGGGEASGPPAVATVTVTVASPSLTVGSTTTVLVVAADAKGTRLDGRPTTYVSSAPAVATVTPTGLVTAVSPGSATVTATVEGKSGSITFTILPIPVSAVIIAPRTAVLRVGETAPFTAFAVDVLGNRLNDRTITWASADPTRLTVTQGGVVTAVASGTAYIRATAESAVDSVQIRVRSLNAPTASAASPALLSPGTTATITGTNFSTTVSENQVLVNGAPAAVTAATATSLTFRVPAATSLPCSATGPVPLAVLVNGDTALINHPLKMATPRSLQVGESLLLTNPDDIACNEFPKTGGRYLFTVFNGSTVASAQVAFRVDGSAGAATGPAIPGVARQAPFVTPAEPVGIDRKELDDMRRTFAAHLWVDSINRAQLRGKRNPLSALKARRSSRQQQLRTAAPVPAVGDVVTIKMRRSLNTSTQIDDLRARAVYVGSKIIIYEDSLAPLARTMDAEYQALGEEFDRLMAPVLDQFGDLLVMDSMLDNNGHISAFFTKRVTDYRSDILGFVTACDFFPRVGPPDQVCPYSNEGEFFYAFLPDPNSSVSYVKDMALWRKYIRGTLAHEAKHILSFATRVAIDADDWEETWLEEATAQQASEIWARQIYQRPWKGNINWSQGPRCDYVGTIGGTCTDNPEGIGHHFSWLYPFYDTIERRSFINNSDGQALYGGSWLFVRWLTDTFGASEPNFLKSLVAQRQDRGVSNVVNRSGRTFPELVGLFSLSVLSEDIPGLTPTDGRLTMPSWNVRDIFAGMNRDLRFSGGGTGLPYPLAFPLRVRAVSFGKFEDVQSIVTALQGGGFVSYDLTGTQTGPQAIGVRSIDGSLPSTRLGISILRAQ
jgi:hypothetical protein